LTMLMSDLYVLNISIASQARSYASIVMELLRQTIHTILVIRVPIDPRYGHSESGICFALVSSLVPISYSVVMSAGVLGKSSISWLDESISVGHAMSE
jgi:hypothetical protein